MKKEFLFGELVISARFSNGLSTFSWTLDNNFWVFERQIRMISCDDNEQCQQVAFSNLSNGNSSKASRPTRILSPVNFRVQEFGRRPGKKFRLLIFISHHQSQVICVTSVGGINTLVVDVIGQRSRDVIGRLSVKPSCHWLVATWLSQTHIVPYLTKWD